MLGFASTRPHSQWRDSLNLALALAFSCISVICTNADPECGRSPIPNALFYALSIHSSLIVTISYKRADIDTGILICRRVILDSISHVCSTVYHGKYENLCLLCNISPPV